MAWLTLVHSLIRRLCVVLLCCSLSLFSTGSYLSDCISLLRPEYAIIVLLIPPATSSRPSLLQPAHTSLALKHSIRLLDLNAAANADGSQLSPSPSISAMVRRVTEAIKATPARFAKASALRPMQPNFLPLPHVAPSLALSCWARPARDRLADWHERHSLDMLVTCQAERAEEIKGFVDAINADKAARGLGLPKNLPPHVAERLNIRTNDATAASSVSSSSSAASLFPHRPLQWFPISLTGGTVNFLSNAHTTAKVVACLVSLFESMRSGRCQRVLLHCAAGIHRTGMMCYALLRLSGLAPTQASMALNLIRQVTAQGVGERIDIVERCVFPLAAAQLAIAIRTEQQASNDMDALMPQLQLAPSDRRVKENAAINTEPPSSAVATVPAQPLDLAAFADSSIDFLIQQE